MVIVNVKSENSIVKAVQGLRLPVVISSDFELGYAVMASSEMKDVVMPDSVAAKYRDYHFDWQDRT